MFQFPKKGFMLNTFFLYYFLVSSQVLFGCRFVVLCTTFTFIFLWRADHGWKNIFVKATLCRWIVGVHGQTLFSIVVLSVIVGFIFYRRFFANRRCGVIDVFFPIKNIDVAFKVESESVIFSNPFVTFWAIVVDWFEQVKNYCWTAT